MPIAWLWMAVVSTTLMWMTISCLFFVSATTVKSAALDKAPNSLAWSW